jgi:hypothetical protein
MNTLEKVETEVRPQFQKNVGYVQHHLYGRGADIGCGSCPLLNPPCEIYADQSEQPITLEAIKKSLKLRKMNIQTKFIISDGLYCLNGEDLFDFIFSSHMLEDLPTVDDMILYLNVWSVSLAKEGRIVLLMPDIEGGRYPKAGEPGSNPSHQIDIGPKLFQEKILPELTTLKLIQIDTIPHTSETFDVVLQRRN